MFKIQIIFVSHFSHNVELKEEGKHTDAVQEGEIHSHHIMVPLQSFYSRVFSLLWELNFMSFYFLLNFISCNKKWSLQ